MRTVKEPSRAPAVNVVQVLGTLDRGGVEGVALELCRRISPADVHQTFLTLGRGEGSLAPRFRSLGAAVAPCPLRPVATFPLRLWLRLLGERPDVVVSHVSLASGPVLAVAALAGVHTRIAWLHSDGDGHPDHWCRRQRRRVMRWVLRHCATEVLGVTSAALAFAGRSGVHARYRVMPNGVDTDRFTMRPRSSDVPTFVHIGRASPEKNRGFVVRVHTEVKVLRADARLIVAGPGGIDDLVAVAPDIAADPDVRLIGETEQVPEVLAEADVLLLPSLREGMPNVVLEALACGVPVLASDLPGLRELAGQVAGISLLPITADPRVWARTALRLAATSWDERSAIGAGIRRSPYTAVHCAKTWRRLWTSR
ncbi:MAG TPA: glycosyltransferase family 4 protein [Pseudonocardiaceae bacterium]|nr:glycosyltransferase family 4 protein [Pseudonocardiaceae bacterium]